MRHEYQSKYPDVAHKIKFFIGDVRSLDSVRMVMPGVDYIFHATALKQVPSCEFFPMEAVRTNVFGTDNVLSAAIEAGVKRLMFSRGSVIPLWIDQIRKGNPITVTEPNMTRFIMSLEEAVDLVLFAFEHGENGDVFVQKAPACTIQTQAEAVCELFGGDKKNIKVIGVRHGEKLFETLLTKEECAKAIDLGDFYRVPADNRDMNYDKYFIEGDARWADIEEFDSDNARRLTLEETKEKIASLEYIQKELAGLGNFVQ